MSYSPECVKAFEEWAAVHEPEHKLEPRTVSPEVAPYECWTANRLFFAFAANWERVRELEKMVKHSWLDGLATGAEQQCEGGPIRTSSELWRESTTRKLLEAE